MNGDWGGNQRQSSSSTGLDSAPWWQQITFGWIQPFINRANTNDLEENDAYFLLPASDTAHTLAKRFSITYSQLKASEPSRRHRTARALLLLYWPIMALQTVWLLAETATRLLAPFLLRGFLVWLIADKAGHGAPPKWQGWAWAVALGVDALALTLAHHQLFWHGYRAGFNMRIMLIAAIYDKVLRLNSSGVSAVSPGFLVNIVSNDVRRFDDIGPYWPHMWSGPLELVCVLLMVSLELGFWPALAGVSVSLMIIPLQALLAQPLGRLRRESARHTDERVRLTGEAINGALAMKMLGWEAPLAAEIAAIRGLEASRITQMARIHAVNMALYFCITPIITFVTFATFRLTAGQLSIVSTFYALSLLKLPRSSMVSCFTIGVQSLTELRVSLRRIDDFLDTPEPPPAPHEQQQQQQQRQPHQQQQQQPDSGSVQHELSSVLLRGQVLLRGADYDWANPLGLAGVSPSPAPPGVRPYDMQLSERNATGDEQHAGSGKSMAHGGPCLAGLHLDIAPGELLGVCGEVGSGKSSLLAALLGELQPLPSGSPVSGGSGEERVAGGAGGDRVLNSANGMVASSSGALGGQLANTAKQQQRGDDVDREDEMEDIPLLPKENVSTTRLGRRAETGSTTVHEGAPQHDGRCCDAASSAANLVTQRANGALVHGSVAYCGQVPWIVAGSVRENIIFGSSYDEAWYREVVTACALDEDIAELPSGDETELGERGINLSGGQKARVALARACYSRADIMLLDDPLSAVDPRVGRLLFDRCLGPQGLMQRATRVLVTHQRQFLPACQRVVVLRGGAMAAVGPWDRVHALGIKELVAVPEPVAGGASRLESVSLKNWALATSTSPAIPSPLQLVVSHTVESRNSVDRQHVRASPGHHHIESRPSDTSTIPLSPSGFSSDSSQSVDCDLNARDDHGDMAASVPQAADVAAAHLTAQAAAAHLAAADMAAALVAAGPALQSLREDGSAADGSAAPTTPPALSQRVASWSSAALSSLRLSRILSFGAMDQQCAVASASRADGTSSGATSPGRILGQRSVSRLRGVPAQTLAPAKLCRSASSGRLVLAEERSVGRVETQVYVEYMRHIGFIVTSGIFLSLVVGQVIWLAAEWWLAMWANATPQEQQAGRWLGFYAILTAAIVCVAVLRSVAFFEATVSAATAIHRRMVEAVLRAPLSFFHTNPAGRILNRFSKDLGQVDDLLPVTLFDCAQAGFFVLGAFTLISLVVPVILPFFIPLLFVFYIIRKRYVCASREVKRWEAVTRSPVFAAFSATLKGLPTIRAFSAQDRFHREFLDVLGHNCAWYFAVLSTARWVGIRLDCLASLTLLVACVLAMASRAMVAPHLLGLALTHVIGLTDLIQWFIRQSAEVENSMTSVERMVEYAQLPQEPPRVEDGGGAPSAGWPMTSCLRYEHVTATYRPGLPPVLRDVSFELQGGSCCGVVGRTGSGKSSLMLTLFRLIDLDAGAIHLDNVDISTIGLDALRRQIAIIPQDPTLFSGTLRSNLDPWSLHPDSRLWEVLEQVRLKEVVQSAGGLQSRMAEAGENLSVGQRQLLCLGRALLQESRILALDEATANVDRATDALIQDALHKFSNSGTESDQRLLLIIAHRIDTIMHCDHLLVLSAGELQQSGRPRQLAQQREGVFHKMVAAAAASN